MFFFANKIQYKTRFQTFQREPREIVIVILYLNKKAGRPLVDFANGANGVMGSWPKGVPRSSG